LCGLATLVVAFILVVALLPEKPSSVERRGAFEIRWYHYDSIGEPGHERMELWYERQRLAEYPTYTSLNPELDRIIYVDAKDLLEVNESENIVFRGWSRNSTMIFSVGEEMREFPVSGALGK